MTKDDARLIGQEYYIDSDECFGCCKTDGDCLNCMFIDVCGEYQEMHEGERRA